jgi:hypothetical protein
MKKNRALFLPHNGSSLTAGVHGRIWGNDTMRSAFNQIPEGLTSVVPSM